MKATSRRKYPLAVRLVMALAAVGLFLIGYQWGNQYQARDRGPPTIAGVLIRPAIPLPEVGLTGASGQPVNTEALAGHWILLAFGRLDGATGQRAVAALVETANRLARDEDLYDDLRLVLVSPDVQPALARDFERLSPLLVIASGNAGEVSALAGAFGADPAADADPTAAPAVYLISPQARLTALFPGGQTPAQIAEDVAALADWPGLLRDDAEPADEPEAAPTRDTAE
jgi:hypothetical protein